MSWRRPGGGSNVIGTFYSLCSVLDGCGCYIVNWDLRESMTGADIEVILERARELHPEAKPRIISGNGPQFTNGKIERWHKSLKGKCIRPGTPLPLDDARRLVKGYAGHSNDVRLNSSRQPGTGAVNTTPLPRISSGRPNQNNL